MWKNRGIVEGRRDDKDKVGVEWGKRENGKEMWKNRGIVEGRKENKDKVGVEGGEKGEQGRKCGKIRELWKEGERELLDTVGVGGGVGWGRGGWCRNT